VPPTIVIDVISHWTFYATPIIDLFVFFMPIVTMYEDVVFIFKVLLMTWTFLVGQQEICLILVLFVASNMASILEVDDNMGHTFI